MNAIHLIQSRAADRCACCGSPAADSIKFDGPDADRKVHVELCAPCRRLLGYMLINDPDQGVIDDQTVA